MEAIFRYIPEDVMINYRMQKAARMLDQQEGNITEIMYSVGFSSLSSFSKGFKARFGVSPKEYSEWALKE